VQLSSIIAGKEWIWPPPRSPKWLELIQCTPTSFLLDDGRRDLVCWKDAPRCMFSIRCTWNLMRTSWSRGRATHNQDWDLIPES
jgi:hypothetical protein